MSLRKVSHESFVFSVFSRNQKKTKPPTWWSVSSEALQSLKSLPMCQASTCGRVQARAQVQVLQICPKQCKSDSRVKIYNSVRARSPLTKSKKKNIERAQQYKKRACQCTDWLSATQNGQGAAKGFSTHQESNPCCLTLCN